MIEDNKSQEKITIRKELKAHLIIALPLAAAYLAEIAMVLTDNAIVGHLGALELAGVGLAANAVWESLVFATSIVAIVGVLVAQAHGAKNHNVIGHHVRQGFWVAVAFSIPTTALCFYATSLLGLTDQDPKVLVISDQYLRTVSWCVLPTMLFTVLRSYVSSLSRATAVMVISVGAVGLNALLTYGMVFGAFGLPEMGVAGAGLSTTIVCWIMDFALVFHTARTQGLKRYRIYQDLFDLDFTECMQIIRLGMPIGGIALMEGGLFMAVAVMMGVLGANALAANQVVTGVVGVMFMVSLAIGEAAGIRVAHGIGAGKIAESRQSGLLGIWLGIGFAILAGLWFIFGSPMIVGFFLDLSDPENTEVLTLCTSLFLIAAAFQLFDGLQVIAARILRGMKDVIVPMWIAAVGYWIFGIGSGYVLAFELGYGPQGLWWGLALGLAITGLMLTGRFVILSRVIKKVNENAGPV